MLRESWLTIDHNIDRNLTGNHPRQMAWELLDNDLLLLQVLPKLW